MRQVGNAPLGGVHLSHTRLEFLLKRFLKFVQLGFIDLGGEMLPHLAKGVLNVDEAIVDELKEFVDFHKGTLSIEGRSTIP